MATDANSKVSIFFGSIGSNAPCGWTETFYSLQTDLQALLAQIVKYYVPARADLLGVGAKIVAVRAASIPPDRITYIETFIPNDGVGMAFTGPNDGFDPIQADLLVRVQGSVGHRRQLWLAGIPDSQTWSQYPPGVKGIAPTFITSGYWKTWSKLLTTLSLGIRAKAPPPAVGFLWEQIVLVKAMSLRNRKRGRPFFLYRGRRLA